MNQQKRGRGRPPKTPEQRAARHLGLRLTDATGLLLDVIVDLVGSQAPLTSATASSVVVGLIQERAQQLGLRVETDAQGVPTRVMRAIRTPERSGRIRQQVVQVWPKPPKPVEFEIVHGGGHGKDGGS